MSDGAAGRPIEILLVEDNPGDVRLTKEAFKEGQIDNEMHVATDGEAALDYLYQRGEHEEAVRPDLVLLDLNLPKVDGIEVLEQVKGDPDLKQIPVIVLSSSEDESDVLKSYENYTNAYLTKPVDPDEFVELVRSLESFWLQFVHLPPRED